MKRIYLKGSNGRGRFALVDDEDYTFLTNFRWYIDSDGYAMARMTHGDRYLTKMHRYILGLTDPKIKPDHRDRNKLNNCRSNLRIATNSDNGRNRNKSSGTSSRFMGVTWHKRDKKWQASFKFNGKNVHVGLFDSEIDAAVAYNKSIIKIGSEFVVLNTFKTIRVQED